MKLWPEDVPEDRALLVDPRSGAILTYGQLEDAITARPGPRGLTFIWSDDSFEAASSYLECLGAGDVVFIGDASIGDDARAALEVRYRPGMVWSPERGFERRDSTTALHPELGLLLSTSGSTGAPKWVRLSRRAVSSNAEAIADYLALTPKERAPLNLPLSYAYGLSILHSHMAAGATLVVTGTNVFERDFWRAFEAGECTSLAGVPYTWRMLLRLRLERLALDRVGTVTQAGGALDVDAKRQILEWAEAHGARFFVMYGQTEATARMSFVPPALLRDKIESIGQAIPGGALDLERQEDGAEELVYTGPNVMMGYATCQRDLALGNVMGGRLHTGDIGCRDEDGFFYVVGRSSRFVKVHGHRIELDWVEREVRDALGCEVAVIGREDCVLAIVEDEAMRTHVQEALRSMQIQRRALRVEVVDALPRSTSGKLSRRQLEEAFFEEPRDE